MFLIFGKFSTSTGLRDGALVRVVGNLREYDGKVHVLVFDVTPVLDWNELSYHLLDIMLTHCQQTKGSIPVPLQCYLIFSVNSRNDKGYSAGKQLLSRGHWKSYG